MSEWYNPLPEDVGVVGGKTKKPKKESQGGSFEFSENKSQLREEDFIYY